MKVLAILIMLVGLISCKEHKTVSPNDFIPAPTFGFSLNPVDYTMYEGGGNPILPPGTYGGRVYGRIGSYPAAPRMPTIDHWDISYESQNKGITLTWDYTKSLNSGFVRSIEATLTIGPDVAPGGYELTVKGIAYDTNGKEIDRDLETQTIRVRAK